MLSEDIKRTPFFCRPLAFLAFIFLSGVFLIQAHAVLFIFYAVAVLAFSLKLLLFVKRGKMFRSVGAYLMITALILPILLVLPSSLNYKKIASLEGAKEIKAVISDVYYDENFGSSYRARLLSIDGEKYTGEIDITAAYSLELKVYDTVYVKAELEDARKDLSGSDLLNALSRELCANAEVIELIKVTNESKNGLVYRIDTFRQTLCDYFSHLLSKDTSAYASALLIGQKGELNSEFKYDMTALGVSHILAVSGMHMSIIASIVALLVERVSYSRKIKSLFVITVSLLFVAVAGFSVSVIRSVIMLIISMLAVFFRGRSDPLTSLFLSGAIICAAEPQLALSCSFLLSFTATLGIVLCAMYAEVRARGALYASRSGDMKLVFKALRWIAFSLLVTLCASLVTIPVLSLYFSQASFFAIVMNLIATPIAFISLVLAILVLGFGKLPFIGNALCTVFDFIYDAFAGICHAVASSFTTSVSLRYPFFAICVIALLSVLLFMWLKQIRNPIAIVGLFIVGAVVYGSGIQIYGTLNEDKVEITYYADKSSEGFLLSSGSQTVFVDVGSGSKSLYKQAFADLTENYYETEFDAYILTHYHSRHIGAITEIISGASPKALYLPYPETPSEQEFYDQILKQIPKRYGPEIKFYSRSQELKIGAITVESTPHTILERSTHPVMIMRFFVNGKSIAYIGGAAFESAEIARVQECISKSSTVVVGRHGPTTKISGRYFGDCSDKQIFLSPYEELDEKYTFSNAAFNYITAAQDGSGKVVFFLNQ